LPPESGASHVTLRDYVHVVAVRWWVVMIVTVACVAVTIAWSLAQTPTYVATALLMYQRSPNVADLLSGSSSTDVTTLSLATQSVVNTISSPTVAQEADAVLDRSVRREDYSVSATIEPPDSSTGATLSDVVSIIGESPRPAVAAAVANAYAQAIINTRANDQRSRLSAAQDAVRAQMKSFTTDEARLSSDYLLLTQRLRDLQVAEATASGDFVLIRPAATPSAPSSPKPLRNGVLAAAVGLFAGVVLVFVMSQFDTRVRTHHEVVSILGLHPVGRVPRAPKEVMRQGVLVAMTDPDGAVAEALRMVRSNLSWSAIDDDWHLMLVTSCRKGEGKTFTACNLAVVLALAGKNVVLVDADFRMPRVHAAFSVSNRSGLTSVIRGDSAVEDAVVRVPLRPRGGLQVRGLSGEKTDEEVRDEGSLLVLPSGPLPPNPGEVAASPRIGVVLRELVDSGADVVLVDAPPLLDVGDAAALARSVDGLLLVVSLARATRPILDDGREVLDTLPCRKLGVVILGEKAETSSYYHQREAAP